MKIIVRACGERTAQECIRRTAQIGEVVVIENVFPFREVLRKTLEIGSSFDQKWVPVIDADVLLKPGSVNQAMRQLRGKEHKVFCLDGLTRDKILNVKRRAGIHIFNRELMPMALDYVRDSIKPETRVRQSMMGFGYKTYIGGIVFGKHDHEQYFRDIYRKAFIQVRKLGGKIRDLNLDQKWPQLARYDDDYKVVLAARRDSMAGKREIFFDASMYRDLADRAIAELGLKEKEPYG